MTKKLLLDFDNDICVVFFEHQGRTYTSAFNNKHDLWAFLQKAPAAIRAGLAASAARAKVRALASTQRIAANEACQVLSEMKEHDVKFLSSLGQKSYGPAQGPSKFDPTKLEF